MGRKVTRKRELCCIDGVYRRTIGKFVNNKNRLVPKKFLLGSDQAAAEIANVRLERLWKQVIARYEALRHGERITTDQQRRLIPALSAPAHDLLESGQWGPHWDACTLKIARGICKHQAVVVFSFEELGFSEREDYAHYIHTLQRDFSQPGLRIEGEKKSLEAGRAVYREQATKLNERAREFSELAQSMHHVTGQPLVACVSGNLYDALDACEQHVLAENVREQKVTAYGKTLSGNIKVLRDACEDIPLASFGYRQLQQMVRYYTSRPTAKLSGKPISVRTVKNMINTLRYFINWLHRNPDYAWQKPPDCDHPLKVRYKGLYTDAELSSRSQGVQVWSVEELALLYRHASDMQRLLMLLGLCCGFARAEISSLRSGEVELEARRIRRLRLKSHVYGELALWPQMVTAIEWHLRATSRCTLQESEHVVLGANGKALTQNGVAHHWEKLMAKIRQHHPDCQALSFKYLRKTANQLIRDVSNGEIAGVFSFRGNPVATDDMSDRYSNRPFDKVFKAQAEVHRQLKPMFDAAPDAFTQVPDTGRRRISRKKTKAGQRRRAVTT